MTEIHRMVEECRAGDWPALIGRMPSGWAIMGQTQVLPGYCLLLPDPVVPSLNHLSKHDRVRYFNDMAELGDAVLASTDSIRINYEILGNLEPALHAHIVPRYTDESDELRTKSVFFYDWKVAPQWTVEEYGALLQRIREKLTLVSH